MEWIATRRQPQDTDCPYCGVVAPFAHFASFSYVGLEFHLFQCPDCESLSYHPRDSIFEIPKPYTEAYKAQTRFGIRYYLEVGYSADFVALCVLSALGAVSSDTLGNHTLVDVGGGLGLSSYLAKTLFSLEVVTVEPSYSGELGSALLGLDTHDAYFEHLPIEVLDALREQPTLLHLNSVVEHLHDPFTVIRQMMGRTPISGIAAVVPDRGYIDPSVSFSMLLPYLAPGDHLHLPTKQGMERLFARLGFAHCEVHAMGALLMAVGSREPIRYPSPEQIAETRTRFMQLLMQHPDRQVSEGAAARLLPHAVLGHDETQLGWLRGYFAERGFEPVLLLEQLQAGDRDMPMHLGTSAYWLGADCYSRGQHQTGDQWMQVCAAYADHFSQAHPHYASQAVDFKWEALLYRAHFLVVGHQPAVARQLLDAIVASEQDRTTGASVGQRARAAEALLRLGTAGTGQPS